MHHKMSYNGNTALGAIFLPFVICGVLFATIIIMLIDLLHNRTTAIELLHNRTTAIELLHTISVKNKEGKIIWRYNND